MKTLKTITTAVLFTLILAACKNEQANQNTNSTMKTEAVKAEDQEEFNVGDTAKEKKAEVTANEQSNEATIIVKANKSLEYKFKINQFDKLTYEWKASAALHYDFHGDPEAKNKYPQGYFESYAIGNSNHVKGKITLPYRGSHGWYWKNTSDKDITITLSTKGKYDIVGLIQ